jgi:cobalt-zinc-cadmium efflux system outer membrane protein
MEMPKTNSIWIVFTIILIQISSACDYSKSDQDKVDSLSITLKDAEGKFRKENLQLIASRYNINSAEAQITQAKLWTNPNISIEQNIYNQTTHRYFDFTSTGNTEVQIQQLFTLAGKKNKQIRVSEINKELSEFTFYDLLRTLKFQLRTDYYDLFFLQQSLKFYNESIPNLSRTIGSVEDAYNKRSMLLSEVIRLKSLLLSLQNEKLGIENQITELQNDMHVLLHDTTLHNTYYIPQLELNQLDSLKMDYLSLDQVIQTGINSRPDYKSAAATVQLDEANLNLQKSLAVPDVTIGGRWSRAGSYIPEYYALSFSIDLPVFNRNQGNIEAAQMNILADEFSRQQSLSSIKREIVNAYQKAIETDKLFKSLDQKFTEQYKTLVLGMTQNFQKRNITIIEFTDFFESYRTSVLQLNQIQNSRLDAFETLNFRIGTDLINP